MVLDYLEKGDITELADLLRDRFETGMLKTTPEDKTRAAVLLEILHSRIENSAQPLSTQPTRVFRMKRWWAAAAIVFVLSGSALRIGIWSAPRN